MSISNLPTEETYTSLITSEHRNKPLFVATVALFVSGFIGGSVTSTAPGDTVADDVLMFVGPSLSSQLGGNLVTPGDTVDTGVDMAVDFEQSVVGIFPNLPFLADIDNAIGKQLDNIGVWVGLPRAVFVNSTLGIVTLDDTTYRQLLYAKIAANHWDGGMESYQAILADFFPGSGIVLKAVDNQDMTIDIYISGGIPTSLQTALLKGGLLVPQPTGVLINGFILPTGPVFGLDEEDLNIAGPDVGSFPTYL
jgi:hypothetical protein